MDSAIFTGHLHRELTGQVAPIYLATDSCNLKDHVASINKKTTEKRLMVDLYAIKQAVALGECGLLWVDGEQNIADAMTKSTPQALKSLTELLRTGRLPVDTMSA